MTNILGQVCFILPQGTNNRPEKIYILTTVTEYMFVLCGQKAAICINFAIVKKNNANDK